MQVAWSPAALDDIGRIYDYVAAFNPHAAGHLMDRLIEAGNALQVFPERGKPLTGGRRELLVIWPYVIRYRLKGTVVEILRVRHGRQRPLP